MGVCLNICNAEQTLTTMILPSRGACIHSHFSLITIFFFSQVNSLPADKLQEIQKAIELFSVGQGPAKTMEEATRRSYQFWDTQPVPKLGIEPLH